MIKAMISSAVKNTSLLSYFIYDGKADELPEWLKAKGVTIVYHKSSLADLMQAYESDPLKLAYNEQSICQVILKSGMRFFDRK